MPKVSQAQTFYEGHSFFEGPTWSFVMGIGQAMRERYEVPEQVPPKLLALLRKLDAIESKSLRAHTLIGKLDAIEGNYLKRYAPVVEPRQVGASADEWPLCT